MTAATAALCGHRWPGRHQRHPFNDHACERPTDHQHDMLLRQPQQCRCDCGATTTREDT